jgi:predicted ATPase/DNA-binding XRE family transcriptional regulator
MGTAEPSSFGELLRRYRTAAGLTQEQLAERAGLSARGVQDLERGLRRSPYPDTTRRLAEALGLADHERAQLLAAVDAAGSSAGSGLSPPPTAAPPIHLTSFIGRQSELAEIQRLLASTRLLTLAGAGGVGKTRLAFEAARRLAADYADGIWLIELATLSDAGLVPRKVASVLGVREASGVTLLAKLIQTLRSKRSLLVLDNCEHLLQACAELADSLLRACPSLHILTTSREPLGIGGETVWRVPSLSVPSPLGTSRITALTQSEAGQLFLERANAALPGFEVTERNAQALAHLCRRLDGIALAIELAAAWVPLLSVEEIVERLDDTLRLLVGGSRVAPPRQQTLRATLDWSYTLVTQPERELFVRLSAFAGGWMLSDAEMVCAGPVVPREVVLHLLARLVKKSLVLAEPGPDGPVRYRLLEPVRQYARERLVETEAVHLVQRQHAQHFLELAERAEAALRGPDQALWLERLDREHDNLRAALAWAETSGDTQIGDRLAAALARFWAIRGHLREGLGWLDAADPVGREVSAARARLLAGSGWLALLRGDLSRARADLESSLALVRQRHDALETAETLKNLGRVALEEGDLEVARRCFAESLMLARARGYRWGIAFNLTGLAQVAMQRGDAVKAVGLFRRGLAGYKELDSPRHVAVTLSNLASARLAQGNVADARDLYVQALEALAGMHDRFGLAHILSGIAGLAEMAGEPEQRAQQLLGAADGLRAQAGYSSSASDHAWPDASLSALTSTPAAARRSPAWDEGRTWSYDQAASEATRAARG